jgi:hypothetical protein
LVDQSVVSNVRRAAAIASCMSSALASVARPSTSPLAGLTFSTVLPVDESRNRPSMNNRVSGLNWTVAAATGEAVIGDPSH